MFALNLQQQLLHSAAHISVARIRCSDAVPRISVKLEITLCRAGFQRLRLTSLKMQVRGWGNFQQSPAAWRLSAFFPGKSWSWWVPRCAWWRGGGCHLFVAVVKDGYLSDVLNAGKMNLYWIRAINRKWDPLFAGGTWGTGTVCLSSMNAKQRWVCSLLVWQGKIKFKLNDRCWCKSYWAGTSQDTSGLEMKRFIAIKAGTFIFKRSEGSRGNMYARAPLGCTGWIYEKC